MRYTKYKFEVPSEKIVRVITNTDAKNEGDDQFAIVQTLLSPKIDNVGLIAAHFGTNRIPDSMEKSYEELEIILDKMNISKENLLYIGTEGQGLKYYNSEKNVVEDYESGSALIDFTKGKIYSILQDKDDNLWLGVSQKGIIFTMVWNQ